MTVPQDKVTGVRELVFAAPQSSKGPAFLNRREAVRLADMAEAMAGVGHWRMNVQGVTTFWSDQIYRIYGLEPGTTPPDLARAIEAFHPDDRAIVSALVEAALKDGKPYSFELRMIWPDGQLRHVMSRCAAEFDAVGKVVGLFGVFMDITELRRAEQSLAKSKTDNRHLVEQGLRAEAQATLERFAHERNAAAERERQLQAQIDVARTQASLHQTETALNFALRAGRLGSWDVDLTSNRLVASDICRANFGLAPDDIFDCFDDVVARVHPDDRELRQKSVDEAISSGADLEVEFRIVKPDGDCAWILQRGRAVYEDGQPVRLAGISMDITERRHAQDRQRLLLDELNHRVKNTLASVQSIAMQTRRFDPEPSAFDQSFRSRLDAMARAHELLSDANWSGASLEEILRRSLAPYVDARAAQGVIHAGPRVRLCPNAAVTLNMAFHELATNAAKYGALSTPTGRVEVRWRRLDGDQPMIIVDWREHGGPPVVQPKRRGFGTRLIERGLAHELSGTARLSFEPAGLWCRITLPLSGKLGLEP